MLFLGVFYFSLYTGYIHPYTKCLMKVKIYSLFRNSVFSPVSLTKEIIYERTTDKY